MSFWKSLFTCGLLLGFILFLAAGSTLRADDRQLLRSSVGKPYVFILLDTSGSMNWSPPCTQAQFDAGTCKPLCPTGDCYVGRQADDPGSKFYQAKQALYEVLGSTSDLQLGFATYNQDDLWVRAKHYLYHATSPGATVTGATAWPNVGDQEVFGYSWACNGGDGTGCTAGAAADLADAWEVQRMQRLSKGGALFNSTTTFFVRSPANTYQVNYVPKSGTLGGTLTVRVEVFKCTSVSNGGNCRNPTLVDAKDVTFALDGELLSWDIDANRSNPQLGYFDNAGDASDTNYCSGWDPNSDGNADDHSNYSLRFPTDSSDSRGTPFTLGDVLPLDWKNDHKTDILRRLAPNTVLGGTPPDFSIATYLKDLPNNGESFLRLENESVRPLIAAGSTPLGNSVRSFRTWYAGCAQGTCPKGSGWKDVAAAQDPDWSCRRKFLLIITDGDDTCGGADPCSATASLFAQEGIKTYVVAFGLQNTPGNRLTCMAANGGSGKPIYPQNKDDLVKALTDIFGQIREEASAFASAAVPSVQAEVADRIYLSSFTPLNGAAVWDGHLDAYLKPLPLSADGKPARSRACPAPGSPNRSSCHLWDAGEVIQGQAAALTDLNTAPAIDEAVLKLGTAPDQRRVFYAKAPFGGLIPQKMRLFSPPAGDPATDPDWSDLFAGLKIPVTTPATPATAKNRAVDILKTTLGVKAAQIDKLDGTKQDITYLLGDIFHSDPVVIDRPNDFSFYANNLNHDPSAIDCTADPGYRCYADKLKRRRKMLAVGSDDGQLHFFDGGVWDPVAKKFSDGTGRELFAVIPRAQLPVVRDLAENGRQVFGIDSTPRVHDVFLDPQHGGTPTAADRRWRTVMVGGYREGGGKDGGGRIADFTSGYYALDVTQPDQLNSSNEPIDQRVVPSCLSTTNGAVAGCGSLPFPTLLWEFNDSIAGSQLDEDDVNRDGLADGNTYPDLGQTWSVPTVGRIRVIEGGQTVDKFVAIFGGGMDAESKNSPKRGTWLYMVDLETGKAIYKRQLVGAAPADPAALDVDLDGILDTLYIGTTAGLLYKVDLSQPAEIKTVTLKKNLAIPALVVDQPVQRIIDPAWDPFPIFDTLGKPIYFAPTAFYVAKLSRFALGFGTGDREDLWSFDNKEGRFYLILDDNFKAAQLASGQLPKDESSYQQIDAEGPDATGAADFVLNPGPGKQRGWYLRLDPSEKVITQTFGLSGVLIFSSYQPQITTQSSGNGNGNNGNGGNKSDPPVCARGGTSRIFVVYANNANSLMTVDGSASRFRQVPEFVTNPYVEQGATKNPGTSPQPNSEQLDANQRAILAALKKFFPPCAKFANYWISVSGIRSDTGYERYATIPVGICESNWKEH